MFLHAVIYIISSSIGHKSTFSVSGMLFSHFLLSVADYAPLPYSPRYRLFSLIYPETGVGTSLLTDFDLAIRFRIFDDEADGKERGDV